MKVSAWPSRMRCFLLALLSILISAHRLPAPIVEEKTPTPSSEQSAKPKSKRVIESKTNRATTTPRAVSTPTPAPSKKFAGTWSGIMPEIPWGNVDTDLIVDQNETTIEWRQSGKSKAAIAKAILNGDTLSARFPVGFTTAVWYISPRADGVTASVRLTAFMNDDTAVFQRKPTP